MTFLRINRIWLFHIPAQAKQTVFERKIFVLIYAVTSGGIKTLKDMQIRTAFLSESGTDDIPLWLLLP